MSDQSLDSPWPVVHLRDVTENVKSWNPSSAGEFTYVDISSIDNHRCEIVNPKHLPGSHAPSRARRPIQDGDVVFSNVRTYLRNVAQVSGIQQPAVASTGFTVLRPKAEIDSRYLYHLTRSDFFIDRVTPGQTGTHYPATSDRVVRDQCIPLPDLDTQRELASLIDDAEQYRLSSSKHIADASRAVGHFRQSVLAAACSGRLTSDWRVALQPERTAENLLADICAERESRLGRRFKRTEPPEVGDDLPEGWLRTTIGALVDVATGATPLRKRTDYYNGRIPWVTSGAVNAGLITEAKEFISELAIKETNAKVFPAGTLLVAMYGEGQTRGRVAELCIDSATNQAVAALLFNEVNKDLRSFIHVFLLENYERIRRLSFGGVQPNLSLEVIRNTAVPLPPPGEQAEIVRRVTQVLALADRLVNRIDAASRAVDRTSQALLSKAFSGGLTTTEG